VIRKTQQRKVIEEVFNESGRPLTPQELFDSAKEKLPVIGLRTVYRHIQDLIDSALIVGIDYPGQPVRYEWVKDDFHCHFICRSCQQVLDLPVPAQELAVNPPKGFTISGQETIFYGTCPNCVAE